uniref:Uncharacterized protein n=1 Tax=Picea glauca TaxID=3330 RepID=A0A101M1D1_PICGL|nr:hypothetical protein ABT39_MTgene3644 [Picea glauca]QHR86405.1 hypothetical protein Q903MT_gene404 [Picea sitchensis]
MMNFGPFFSGNTTPKLNSFRFTIPLSVQKSIRLARQIPPMEMLLCPTIN